MTYKRDQRKKKIRRMREFPHMFRAGVPIGSFNQSKGPDPDGDKATGRFQRYIDEEEFLASL